MEKLGKLIRRRKKVPPELMEYSDMGRNDIIREIKKQKEEIKELLVKQTDLYSQEVQANPKAQTYLYQPYSYKMKFYKIFSMMMKVALLCILLFVPPSVFTGGKMVFGAVVVLIQAFLAGNFTP